MRRREFLYGTAVGCSLWTVAACSHKSAKALDSDSEQQITALLDELKVPGLSIAVIKNARVDATYTFGFKNSESKEPVDSSTVFEAGSMSKPVFAYAVMKLCEKGILALDTPLTKYTTLKFVQHDSRLDRITTR